MTPLSSPLKSPLRPTSARRVIVFDGVCTLCAGWVQFVIRRDPTGTFQFASLQSDAGAQILERCGLDPNACETMVLVEEGRAYVRSSAVLGVVKHLSWPWPLLSWTRVIPPAVRNWVYDQIATRRYRLFGKRDACLVPTPELQKRFL